MPATTSIFSSTRVGSPPTPFSYGEAPTSSKAFRESTHLIPTPPAQNNRPQKYEPILFWLPVAIGTPLLMLGLGVALEVAIEISSKNGGFAVPSRNVFSLVSTQFLLAFFPGIFVLPVGYLWRSLDWMLRLYQPYIAMSRGNARAEESVLPFRSMFRALHYNHRVIFWSCLLATSTYLYQSLAGSIFQLQTRNKIDYAQAQSIRSLGLDPDVAQLNAFAAAAGFVQAAVFNDLGDPPFIKGGWSAAQFVFPTNTGLNGSMTVNTTGILSNSNCSNPTAPPLVNTVNLTSGVISSRSIDGCTANVTFDPSVSDQQYGVAVGCGPNASSNVTLAPVVFWFFQNQTDGTPEVRTIFCEPSMELFYVSAAADLTSGQLTGVNITNNYTSANNVSGPPTNGLPFNAVIFENNTNPFIQARATATHVGVPGAIFRAALQNPNGLQSIFDLPNGFLDLTSTIYSKNHWFFDYGSSMLFIDVRCLSFNSLRSPLPGHALAFLLFASGFLGVFLHLISRRQRRALYLTAPPGTAAAALALTARSGFGELLLPYDDFATLEKKLDGLRFRLDKRTGAILADAYDSADDASFRGPDDARMSLLGNRREAHMSSTQLAQEMALEVAEANPASWKRESLKTPYDK
ncbi:hypothetical protein GGX14DRAFT_454812 [Mycena pura]|uniref:Uncharacterized protein n=1 Tax=Mycena pura TaxID=153505 RepID=A0AAD6VB16_9AGAR|nr:hypothetical protein GGX14DRAFT_454812 [Mycena pura]